MINPTIISRTALFTRPASKPPRWFMKPNRSFMSTLAIPTTIQLQKFIYSPSTIIPRMSYVQSRLMISSTRTLSSSEKGVFDRIRGSFAGRTDRKKKEQVQEQLLRMSNCEVWNLKTYAADLESSMSDWKTKIPGMGYTQQVKTLKQAEKILKAVRQYVGEEATSETLTNLTRKDKLKIAVEGDILVDDVDVLIGQFQNMHLMHRVLRYRKENGKSIPKDEASMTLAVQKDAMKVMSKKERAKMAKTMQTRAMRGMR